MRRQPFPHRYAIELSGDDLPALLSAPGHPDVPGGAPPQFGGSPAWWSPEELLLGALALCHLTTVRALAARQELPIVSFAARAEGVLDKTRQGLAFTKIRLQVDVGVAAADAPRAEALVHTAKRHCIVANALNVPVELEAKIVAC